MGLRVFGWTILSFIYTQHQELMKAMGYSQQCITSTLPICDEGDDLVSHFVNNFHKVIKTKILMLFYYVLFSFLQQVEKYLLQFFSFFKCLTTNFVFDFVFEWWMMFLCCRKNRRCGVKYPTTRMCGRFVILCLLVFYSTSSKQGNHQMDIFFNKFKST